MLSRNTSLAVIAALLLAACATRSPAQAPAGHSAAYESADRKIKFLASNGQRQAPEPVTTVLTAPEINAYLAEGGVALPVGVQRVSFSSVPAVVNAVARVDLDKVMAGGPKNFLVGAYLKPGVHDVVVEAQATGSNGTGSVRISSVVIDGVKIPQAVLQFLVDYYLKPRYGNSVGLNSTFRLPARINMAVVGSNQVSLTQR